MPYNIRKKLGKIRRQLFRTNHAYWYCKHINDNDNIKQELENNITISYDLSQTVGWIKKMTNEFPWIYNEKEIDFAYKYNHSFSALLFSDEIIGYVKIAKQKVYIDDYEEAFTLEKNEAFICGIFILPDFRKKHFGRTLLKKTIQELQKNNFSFIFCHVPGWNIASAKMFRRLGFQRIGHVRYVRLMNFRYFSNDPIDMKAKGRKLLLSG